jgi:nucleoside-diphosphate-sugar epimerase
VDPAGQRRCGPNEEAVMNMDLPGIVVTGASGFVGRHFVASAAGRYRLFCLARRSRRAAGIPEHENMRWSQVDIARWDTLREVVSCVKRHGGACTVLHLAGYYDFHNMEHPEYERTNVLGTRHVLKLAGQLGVDRFIFASSLAACRFPRGDEVIDEEHPCDAKFAYARSKRQGEDMVREHADRFPSAIVRMAAMYSDWCEYPPLYMFLRTWLGDGWSARVLGGRGESAVPYLHVADLVRLFHEIIERRHDLPRSVVLNASPNGCTTHRELFETATRDYYGEAARPVLMPRAIATVGVIARWWLGKLRRKPPFEAPWMMSYIDRQLRIDATRTHELMDWRPTRRLDVNRRLLLMVENMKSHRELWQQRNEAALARVADRPNLRIAGILDELREDLVPRIADVVGDPACADRYCRYNEMDREALEGFLRLLLQVVITSVRTGERRLIRHYAQVVAMRRRDEGFTLAQVQAFLRTVGGNVVEALQIHPELESAEAAIHDHVQLGFDLAIDGVEDAFESLDVALADVPQYRGMELPGSAGDLERLVRELEDICGDGLPTSPGQTG